MISALSKFTAIEAASILSRAGFSIDDPENPAALPKIPNELSLREIIIGEIRRELNISSDDKSEAALDRIVDAIDHEITRLTDNQDQRKTLLHLAEAGAAPSDLFLINVIENVEEVYKKKWLNEHEIIKSTVYHADQEQHFGHALQWNDPSLISIFIKNFPHPHPYKSFTMLVIGKREGFFLHVHQAWHIYADNVSLQGTKNLLDVLRRFVDVFGAEIKVQGEKTKFWLKEIPTPTLQQVREIEMPQKFKTNSKGKKTPVDSKYTTSMFFAMDQTTNISSEIIFSIDLDKYQLALKAHGW